MSKPSGKLFVVLWGDREGQFHLSELRAHTPELAKEIALRTLPSIQGVGDVAPGSLAKFRGKHGRRIMGDIEGVI